MNPINAKLKKTSGIILVITRIVGAVLLLITAYATYMTFSYANSGSSRNPVNLIALAVQDGIRLLTVIAALFIASSLLKSIKRDYTPFTAKNVKRLKLIALLVAAMEPFNIIFGLASKLFYSTIPTDSEEPAAYIISTHSGGLFIAIGLIVFCIALVFDYGAKLQQQSDETL